MHRVITGDCLDVMSRGTPNTFDAIVTDPPYGLSFMGQQWDHGVPGVPFWEQALRVTKPGGMLLAFGGTRTFHRLICAIEDAGWEIRDCLMWLYGSGFPKSHNIGKALDKQKYSMEEILEVTAWIRVARDAAGKSNADIDAAFGFHGMSGHWTSQGTQPAVPTIEQVPQLLEFLGATPPEHIADLMWTLNAPKGKPGPNWFKREAVGVRKDGCGNTSCSIHKQEGFAASRKQEYIETASATDAAKVWEGYGTSLKPAWEPIILAMKPCDGTFAQNAQKHGVAGLNIDACRIGPATKQQPGRWPSNLLLDEEAGAMLDERSGSVSRFFYCAKASKKDRGEGNTHPTVKPSSLMQWLCRLVKTPTGGKILDPFCGSGSTGVAAIREGIEFVGIEQSEEYATIARTRLEAEERTDEH